MALRTLLLSRDPEALRVFRRVLDDCSVEIEVCARATLAMAKLEGEKFDAVLLDCDGVANADEILRALPQSASNKRAIAVAIIGGITSLREAFAWGAHFVLEKPLSVERTGRCVRAALGFMLAEQRRYFRQPLSTTAHLSFGSVKHLPCATTNISEGGMAIKLSQPLAGQTLVEIAFALPGMDVGLEAKGEVAWSDAAGNAGIRFVQVSPDSRRALCRWLESCAAPAEAPEIPERPQQPTRTAAAG